MEASCCSTECLTASAAKLAMTVVGTQRSQRACVVMCSQRMPSVSERSVPQTAAALRNSIQAKEYEVGSRSVAERSCYALHQTLRKSVGGWDMQVHRLEVEIGRSAGGASQRSSDLLQQLHAQLLEVRTRTAAVLNAKDALSQDGVVPRADSSEPARSTRAPNLTQTYLRWAGVVDLRRLRR